VLILLTQAIYLVFDPINLVVHLRNTEIRYFSVVSSSIFEFA
jgi:hypothetical protein